MSDIYVVTRYLNNEACFLEDFFEEEVPIRAFLSLDAAKHFVEHGITENDILGSLAKLYTVNPQRYEFQPNGIHYGGIAYVCEAIEEDNDDEYNVSFVIYKVEMEDNSQ